MDKKFRFFSNILIIIAAAMWGIDGVLLTPSYFSVFHFYNVEFIVFVAHFIPFIFFSFRSIKQYNYYMNEQPSYQSLITVHGRIIADNRAPPEPYNKRHDGIYIQTNNGNINVYCDHPDQLLIGYGASRGGGTYDLGQCKWVSGKMKKYGFCATGNEIACQDPRFFYGHEVVVKMNAEQTIYELTIDEDKKIYSYQNMLLFYKEQYLFLGYVYYSITFIFLVLGGISFRKWLKARRA